MNLITVGEQATLDGGTVKRRRNVFSKPIEELRAMVEAAQVECYECEGKGRVGKRMVAVEVYDSPWQEEPKTIYVCTYPDPEEYGRSCFDLLTDESWADFRYFECQSCYRMVIRQCPSNGWHSYVREWEDEGEVCLKCYERPDGRYSAMDKYFEAKTTYSRTACRESRSKRAAYRGCSATRQS